jgi:hypothetical protein
MMPITTNSSTSVKPTRDTRGGIESARDLLNCFFRRNIVPPTELSLAA